MPEVINPPGIPVNRPPIDLPPESVYRELSVEAVSIQTALNQLQGTLGELLIPFTPVDEAETDNNGDEPHSALRRRRGHRIRGRTLRLHQTR